MIPDPRRSIDCGSPERHIVVIVTGSQCGAFVKAELIMDFNEFFQLIRV